jgi:hypothetical protein
MSLLDSLRQRLKVIERQFADAIIPIRELDDNRPIRLIPFGPLGFVSLRRVLN